MLRRLDCVHEFTGDMIFFFDWDRYFLPATLALLNGQNPSAIIFNAPWVTIPLIPFAMWGHDGAWLVAIAALVSLAFVAVRLGAKRWGLLAFLSVPYTLGILWTGNIEWLALLGLVMPQSLGLVLLAIKPQMTMGIMLFWAWQAWREKRLVKTLVPLAIITPISFVLFGNWIMDKTTTYTQFVNAGNASFFPFSLPIGFALMVAAMRMNDIRFALAASPCFFPVLTPQCWIAPMLALVTMPAELFAASIGVWLMGLIPNGRN